MPLTLSSAPAGTLAILQRGAGNTWDFIPVEFNSSTGVLTISSDSSLALVSPQDISGALSLADGSYTLGLGGTAVGMLNVLNGVISIQDAPPGPWFFPNISNRHSQK